MVTPSSVAHGKDSSSDTLCVLVSGSARWWLSMLIPYSDMFPAASQAVIRLLVHFKKKKFMVVVAGDATFQDVKTEIVRVYQGISSTSPDESPPTVGEVQDVYGCALFSEYPVATILRDLSDVYAFEEGETPPTVAEQGPSMPDSLPYYGLWPYQAMQSTPGFPCGSTVSLDAKTDENSCVLTPPTNSYCSSPLYQHSSPESTVMQSPSKESTEAEVYGREKKPKWKKRKYKSAAIVVESDSSSEDKKQKHPQKERQEVDCIYPGFSSGWSSEEEKTLAHTRQEYPETSNCGEERTSGGNECRLIKRQERVGTYNLEDERTSGANEHRFIEIERQEHPETSSFEEEERASEHRLTERQEDHKTPNLEEERTSGANEHRLIERQESAEISSSEDEGTSASEECICIEKQEDAETSNSEGERTSAHKVVERQELDEPSSSEEERTFIDNEHRLVERQKLAETSKSTSTEVNRTALLKRKSEALSQSSCDSESSTESTDEKPHKFIRLSPLSALVGSHPQHRRQQDLHERRHQDLQRTVTSSSSQSQSVFMKLSELLDDEELWD